MTRNILRLDKFTAAVLIVVTLLCLGGAFALFARQAGSASPAATPPPPSSAHPHVETARLGEGPLEVEFTRRGTLRPSAEVNIFPEVTGRVVKRSVGVGDAVKKGDVLFELDGALLEIKLSEAQSRLKSAQVRMEEVQSQFAGAQNSEDDDLKRDARLRRDAAEAALKLAESEAAEAQKTHDARTVRSPIGGTVAQILAAEGEFAAPAQPIARIIVAEPMVAVVPLTAAETSSLRGDIACRVAVPEGQQPPPEARLLRLAPVADPRTKRISAEVEVKNADGRLRAGMPIDVTFRAKSSDAAVVMPRRALTLRSDTLVCFRIEKASAGYVARRVEPVVEAIPGRAESLHVLAGLSAGDLVAVSGLIAIDDGMEVQVVPSSKHSG
ncbi:MAG: efflux RND transporter periplasmic adaptor subunit [Pirellulales bacterium]|nr:efflux RND transporter periplasmic adaptor subunit [Pirellulales bacterium]